MPEHTIAENLQRLVAAKTAIGSAITAKGGTVGANDGLEEFATDIATIPSSSEGSFPNAVNFYDYDGTIVQSYSASDFANLSALPANPTHTGLTAQGWNWSLVDAKAYVADYGSLNIGQKYVTSDGKTRLYISLTDGRLYPMLQLYLNENSELDIDWGDGSTHSTFTSTTAGYKSTRHGYVTSGDYVIAITVVSGGFALQSSSTSVSSILWDENNSQTSPDGAYNNAIKKVEIGTGVTTIGDYAFYRCYSLSSITIPNSVTSIGAFTFHTCRSLSSITIPDGVTVIGNNTFQNCSALSSVTLPDGVTGILNSAFRTCSSLPSITIPDSVDTINDSVFGECPALSSITIPDGAVGIGTGAFQTCSSLSSITIPSLVTSIRDRAFQYCYALSSITIPNSVTSIGNQAFNGCSYMSYIKFESTTPPTVSNSNAWTGLSPDTIILVPTGTLSTYEAASNYPNPSTYTYEEY